MLFKVAVLLQVLCYYYVQSASKPGEVQPAAKFDNPNFVRDRLKMMSKNADRPETWMNRHKTGFNSVWMDFCDPSHCNDYHKIVCGLNRKTLRFQWFQSVCHLIYNNMCSYYRGKLKFDLIDSKFCVMYVLDLRSRCPRSCGDEVAPTCGSDPVRNHTVLFKNKCALDMAKCRADQFGLETYEEVNMAVCNYYLHHMYTEQ